MRSAVHLTIPQLCAWINTLLLAGCVISAAGGGYFLFRSKRFPVFMLRQRAWRRGWKLILMSVLLLIAFGLMLGFGRQGLEYLLPVLPRA